MAASTKDTRSPRGRPEPCVSWRWLALAVVKDAAEFALWLSPHILANTGRVLATVLKTPDDEVDDYLRADSGLTMPLGEGE